MTMDVERLRAWQEEHGVVFVRRDQYWPTRLLDKVFDVLLQPLADPRNRTETIPRGEYLRRYYWTTFRLPFQKTRFAFPTTVQDPLAPQYEGIIEHELFHHRTIDTFFGLVGAFLLVFFLPLPIFFSGRWHIERYAYLNDIHKGRRSVESAVASLWNFYLWPWPKKWMAQWFVKKLLELQETESP